MSGTIQATYHWTADDMVQAQLLHTTGTRGRYRWLRLVALGSMMLVATTLFVQQGIFDTRILGFVAVAWIAVMISEVSRHPMWVERKARRLFDRHMSDRQRVRMTITDQGIESVTDGMGEGQAAWSDIERVLETPDGFLLYLSKQVFLWVPKRAFRPKTDLKRFIKMVKKHDCEYTTL